MNFNEEETHLKKLEGDLFNGTISAEIKRSNKDLRTIEILDYFPSNKDCEIMNVPKEKLKDVMMYGSFQYSYS